MYVAARAAHAVVMRCARRRQVVATVIVWILGVVCVFWCVRAWCTMRLCIHMAYTLHSTTARRRSPVSGCVVGFVVLKSGRVWCELEHASCACTCQHVPHSLNHDLFTCAMHGVCDVPDDRARGLTHPGCVPRLGCVLCCSATHATTANILQTSSHTLLTWLTCGMRSDAQLVVMGGCRAIRMCVIIS